MRKFTIFTFILTVIIVVVAAEVIVTDYLPQLKKESFDDVLGSLPLPDSLDIGGIGSANVLGSDIAYDEISNDPLAGYEEVEIPFSSGDELPPIEEAILTDVPLVSEIIPSDISDFEDESYVSISQNVYIREDMIRSAGFIGAYLEKEPHNGFLYKTIYIDDLYDVDIVKNAIRNEDSLLGKVYVFTVGPLSSAEEVYEVLKVRGTEGLDIEINETNDFGDESFYMNDARRQSVAFLTVRFGGVIYGFSYPKEYHAQIANLVKLIDNEF